MAFVEGQTIRGWGVFRPDPWSFDSIHPTRAKARERAKALGQGYQVQRGENEVGTDNFSYGDIGFALSGRPKSTRMVQHQLTWGDSPLMWNGSRLVISLPEENSIEQTLTAPTAAAGAAFAGRAFAGDAFATSEAANDDGIHSIDEPLPDISEFELDAEDDTPSANDLLPGQSYLTDEEGNYLTTEDGEYLVTEVDETLLRQEIERNLALVDDGVDAFRSLAMRTHNQPPELVDDLPVDPTIIDEIDEAKAEIKKELSATVPNATNLQAQLVIFERIKNFLFRYRNEILVNLGTAAAYDVMTNSGGIVQTLLNAVGRVAHLIAGWIAHINPPF